MIAGEYAVLEPHQPAVVVAVDRFMTAAIAPAADFRLSLPGFGPVDLGFRTTSEGVAFEGDDPRLRFVKAALAVALAYVRSEQMVPRPFHLTIASQLDDADGRKFGLGSSAAATVAAVAAVVTWLRGDDAPPPGTETIFKLAAIAHLQAQGSGSGADVAASTYGGWLRYSSFSPAWLSGRLARGSGVAQLLAEPWPFFSAERLSPLPRDLRLLAGWTGTPASTASLIPRVTALRAEDPAAYEQFLAESVRAVDHLVNGLTSANRGRALDGLERNRKALATLGERAGVPIETEALATLARLAREAGGAGKLSGAGGGDCGVAIVFGDPEAARLTAAWEAAGLTPLPLGTSDAGASVTELVW